MMSYSSEAARTLQPTTARSEAYTCNPAQEAIKIFPVRRFHSTPMRWWLWWNVLSLDAPTVAGVWSLLLLRSTGMRGHFADVTALVLAVWIIYSADRLLDGLAFRTGSVLQRRHSFCARHRLVLSSLIVVAGTVLLWISMVYLEGTTVHAGLSLGAIVGLYLASIHVGPTRLSRSLPKEIAVGAIFAAGTSIPLLSRSTPLEPSSIVTLPLFALLCSLNCLSIECWERPTNARAPRQTVRSWIAWADLHLDAIAIVVTMVSLLAGLLSGSGGASRIPPFAISFSASLTLVLNSQRRRLSPEALRVLADAALALPALAALAQLY